MFKEVAIDPKCMAEFIYYVLIRREFGFEKGRYASADVKQWAQEAFQHVKKSEMQTIKKKSVKNYLNRVRQGKESEKFLLAGDRKSVVGSDWKKWWIAQMEHRPFPVSVSEGALENTINSDDILEDCAQWKVSPSISLGKSAQEITEAIMSLIYISREVLLVDQYFRFTANSTLVELFKILSACSVTRFTVVTSMEAQNLQQVYDRDYKNINIKPVKFRWIQAPDKYFHDRYIVTDVGAVKAGQGFTPDIEKGAHADKLNINLVSVDEAQGVKESLDVALENGVASVKFTV